MAIRSKTTMFNAALLRTGNDSIVEGDGSSVWQALEANYDEIVREAFESGDYPFGRARSTLTSRSVGRWGFDDAYVMPSDVIHVSDVFLGTYSASDILAPWEIDATQNELLVNAAGRVVEIEYLKVGLEHTWSALFAKGIQNRLEAVIKDFLDEASEASGKDQDAELQFLKSGAKASKSRSKRRVFKKYGGRLVRAHRTRQTRYFGG